MKVDTSQTGRGGAKVIDCDTRRLDHAAEQSLTEIEQIYRHAPVGLCLMDKNYRYVRINERMAEINGRPVEAHLGHTLREVIPDLADRVQELYRPVYERGEAVLNVELRGVTPGDPNVQRDWLANFFPFRSDTGEIIGLLAAVVDITDRKRAELEVRQSEERLRTIFDSVSDAILVLDLESTAFLQVNKRACELFGYPAEDLLQLSIADLSENRPPYTMDDAQLRIRKAHSGMTQTFEWRAKTKSGDLFWIEIALRRAAFGGSDLMLATIRDITDRKRAEERLTRLARMDILTELPNRAVFVDNVSRGIDRARRLGNLFAVLYLDLDHFKDTNDTLGHPIGDQLLQSVAERLKRIVRTSDTVARFGGDEFAVLLTDISHPADAGILAEKIIGAIGEPFLLDGNVIHSGASVGIAVSRTESAEAEVLLSHADVALYQAKSEGRHTWRFFDDEMDRQVRERVELVAELRRAIDEDQLFLTYQPQVDLKTRRIVGIEALVSWRHPIKGILAPGVFVPAAERSGLIGALGRWILQTACVQMKRWLDDGVAPAVLSVNLSALQFKAPRDLERDIDTVLSETGLPPHMLELELTESVVMEASHHDNSIIERLRGRGLRIAIDDFGTGNSSLLYLRRLPVDRIKVAQEFVKDLFRDPSDAAIVNAAIGLARVLGIEVVAEGVETAEQLSLLATWGCRVAQGFYLAKPMSAEAIGALLHTDCNPRLSIRSFTGTG